MTFLQPFLPWGRPLVLVPVITHLINRLRHLLANDLTLASRNTSEFGRVPGLRVEDWTQAVSAP